MNAEFLSTFSMINLLDFVQFFFIKKGPKTEITGKFFLGQGLNYNISFHLETFKK